MVLRVRTPGFASRYFSKSELQGLWYGIRGSCITVGRRRRKLKERTIIVRVARVKVIKLDTILD